VKALAVRGGGGFAVGTAILSMIAAPVSNDVRPMAMGFGVLLLAGAVAIPVVIGQDATVTGRRRVGLGFIQAGAGLLVGAFGLLALSAALPISAGWGGISFLLGIAALPIGGIVHTEDPVRSLTVAIGRLAFVIFVLSSIFLGLVLFIDGPGGVRTLDYVVVSGISWLACWIYAHGRGWRMAPDPGPGGWTSGGGGGYSSWSSSGYSSSSGSGSSYSGGGGDSGGGGSSGSW
jgi:hypothetical protein